MLASAPRLDGEHVVYSQGVITGVEVGEVERDDEIWRRRGRHGVVVIGGIV